MQSHKSRARKFDELKAKRKELKKTLELEEKKINFLEDKLREKKERRREDEERRVNMEKASTQIQSSARRIIGMRKFKIYREKHSRVTLFLQALFRGSKDRKVVEEMRLRIIQHQKEELASIQIQRRERGRTVRAVLERRRKEEEIVRTKLVCRIQAFQRGRVCRVTLRRKSQLLKESNASVFLQCIARGMIGRRIAKCRRRAKRKKKIPCSTKSVQGKEIFRIPLQERRYSTYCGDRRDSTSSDQRRLSEILIRKPSNPGELRSSVSGLDIVRMAHAKLGLNSGKSNGKSDTSSIDIDTVELDSVTSTVDSETAKLRLARKRAAARSAKLKRDVRREKEKVGENAKARKEELDELDLKRRNQLKEKIEMKKSNPKKKSVAVKDHSVSIECSPDLCVGEVETKDTIIQLVDKNSKGDDGVTTTELIVNEEHNENDGTEVRSYHQASVVPFETLLEDNFEDDFSENEDDLE